MFSSKKQTSYYMLRLNEIQRFCKILDKGVRRFYELPTPRSMGKSIQPSNNSSSKGEARSKSKPLDVRPSQQYGFNALRLSNTGFVFNRFEGFGPSSNREGELIIQQTALMLLLVKQSCTNVY